MRKFIISVLLLCLLTATGAVAQPAAPRNELSWEQIQLFLSKLRSAPDQHRIRPDSLKAAGSPYIRAKNYGKDIAVFGGSLSVNAESDAAKQIWADMLGARVTTYGVGGAGFALDQGYSIQKQVDTAGVHDIYILWASTNDFTNSRPCGTWSDYTAADNYSEEARMTQCGGINYCIKKIMEKNPRAEIYFFTSLRFYSQEAGYNPFSAETNETGKTFAEYIEAQRQCCLHYGVPLLDQFSLQGINIFNYKAFYKDDNLHMTEEGYRRIGPLQAQFLSNGM